MCEFIFVKQRDGLDSMKKATELETMPKAQIELLSRFAESKDKSEVVEILQQLFDKTKINMITDLTPDEIKLITAIFVLSKMKKLTLLY